MLVGYGCSVGQVGLEGPLIRLHQLDATASIILLAVNAQNVLRFGVDPSGSLGSR